MKDSLVTAKEWVRSMKFNFPGDRPSSESLRQWADFVFSDIITEVDVHGNTEAKDDVMGPFLNEVAAKGRCTSINVDGTRIAGATLESLGRLCTGGGGDNGDPPVDMLTMQRIDTEVSWATLWSKFNSGMEARPGTVRRLIVSENPRIGLEAHTEVPFHVALQFLCKLGTLAELEARNIGCRRLPSADVFSKLSHLDLSKNPLQDTTLTFGPEAPLVALRLEDSGDVHVRGLEFCLHLRTVVCSGTTALYEDTVESIVTATARPASTLTNIELGRNEEENPPPFVATRAGPRIIGALAVATENAACVEGLSLSGLLLDEVASEVMASAHLRLSSASRIAVRGCGLTTSQLLALLLPKTQQRTTDVAHLDVSRNPLGRDMTREQLIQLLLALRPTSLHFGNCGLSPAISVGFLSWVQATLQSTDRSGDLEGTASSAEGDSELAVNLLDATTYAVLAPLQLVGKGGAPLAAPAPYRVVPPQSGEAVPREKGNVLIEMSPALFAEFERWQLTIRSQQ